MTTMSGETATLVSGWRTVRFGDVVRNVKIDVDPETSGLERYIAGEHMDTDDLHIHRWGTIGDGYLGPAFHRKFVSGQVLYGSRRTYLRKVAVADFDGVCANTTFVLEPNGDELLPELLPFIMQTDAFNEHSIKQSRGSVNPYINWSDLVWYEFPLPPLDEQRRIAEILWAAEDATQQFEESTRLLEVAKQHYFDDQMSAIIEDSQAAITLGDICTVQNGQVDPTALPYNQMVHIAPDDIESGTGRILELRTAEDDRIRSGKYEFSAQAILYSKIRPNLRKVAHPKFAGICSADVYPLYPRVELVEPDFFFHLLLSQGFTDYAVMHSVRSAIPKINRENLLQYRFCLPSIERQRKMVSALQMFGDASVKCAQHIGQSRKVKTVLLNRVFQPEQR